MAAIRRGDRSLSVPVAEATAKPIISGMTYKGHNADGLLTETCGCCPGDEDCLGFYECNHEERREELAQCAAKALFVPTARPTLAGQTFEGNNADGFYGALCGCICPEDDCAGLYLCTQGERAAQLAQCPMPAPAPETVKAVAYTKKEEISSVKSTSFPVDGLLTAVCGCICPEDDCMTLVPCTQGDFRREQRRCAKTAAGSTRRLGESRLN